MELSTAIAYAIMILAVCAGFALVMVVADWLGRKDK